MAENSSSEENQVMDYAEHDRTYHMFLVGAKWLTLISAGILIGMAFGFFAGFGFLGGTLMAIISVVVANMFI